MAYRLVSVVFKILLASLLVGVALSSINVTAAQVLQDVGGAPRELRPQGHQGALPHIILGALITVPIWLVMYLLRPPRGD